MDVWGQGKGSTSILPHPWPGHPEPTLRYWYKQMDIQLDSILSTTVSDLQEQSGDTRGIPQCPWAQLAPPGTHSTAIQALGPRQSAHTQPGVTKCWTHHLSPHPSPC